MSTGEALHIVLFSFGFKYGTPVDVNYLMDMRFLPNPYWVPELKEKTGTESGVADYVLQSEAGKATVAQLTSYFDFIIAQNLAAGKKTLRIGIGCTGGRHRSVAITEELGRYLRAEGTTLRVFHRDMYKDGPVTDC
ncbi:RapZ C-terminal domain-containing protein [Desulforhopalus sp. 52FAK]